MAAPKIWSFQQLGGDQKVMYLNGWSAPFGRPRNGTVVNSGVDLRQNTTYYPGNVEPTVHIFGVAPSPWELTGRFMDQAIGNVGSAKNLRREWFDFVADGQMVRAKWGDILSYRIVINGIDLNFESEAEVAWKMRATVLADESAIANDFVARPQTPLSIANQLNDFFNQATLPFSVPSVTSIRALLNQISDLIDSIITTMNAPFAAVYGVCSALTDFLSASSSDLSKIGSGITLLNTGLLNLRDSTTQLASAAVRLASPTSTMPGGLLGGTDVAILGTAKAASDAAISNLLALINDMQNEIDASQRGRTQGAAPAQAGDTWETIAQRVLGGSDGGRAIRDMNRVRHGQKPVAGRVYVIPRA